MFKAYYLLWKYWNRHSKYQLLKGQFLSENVAKFIFEDATKTFTIHDAKSLKEEKNIRLVWEKVFSHCANYSDTFSKQITGIGLQITTKRNSKELNEQNVKELHLDDWSWFVSLGKVKCLQWFGWNKLTYRWKKLFKWVATSTHRCFLVYYDKIQSPGPDKGIHFNLKIS